jgi:hypothetical protein
MPPQKRSKKNTPAETDQEEHHHDEGNGISLNPEPLNITDQKLRANLRLYKEQELRRPHTL